MSHRSTTAISALVLLAAPFVWVACGGSKPPETPADENSSSEDGGSAATPADSSSSTDTAPAASASSDTSSDSAPAASAAAAPPAAPNLGDTDCGKCIDKTCAKPAAACGKNTDCQAVIDGIHGCNSGAASCIQNATAPSSAKPKKLAAAYTKCATKAMSGKACKASCSQ